MRFTVALFLSLAVVVSVSSAPRAQSAYDEGENGRFRVEFDPGNRVAFGVGVMARNAAGETRVGSAFLFSLSRRRNDENPDEAWKLETIVLETAAGRMGPRGDRRPYLDVRGLQGTYIRFSSDPHLTLPTTQPRRIWFPFNPGVRVEALRLQVGLADVWELSVVDAGLILDAIRSPAPGTRAWFGVSARYELTGDSRPDDHSEVESVLTPFSLGTVGFSHEWGGGLYQVSADTAFGSRWSTLDGWSMQGEGAARVSVTPLAINDRPLVLFAEARFEFSELETGIQAGPLVAISGLAIGVDRD